jgi:hypothetical protein
MRFAVRLRLTIIKMLMSLKWSELMKKQLFAIGVIFAFGFKSDRLIGAQTYLQSSWDDRRCGCGKNVGLKTIIPSMDSKTDSLSKS